MRRRSLWQITIRLGSRLLALAFTSETTEAPATERRRVKIQAIDEPRGIAELHQQLGERLAIGN